MMEQQAQTTEQTATAPVSLADELKQAFQKAENPEPEVKPEPEAEQAAEPQVDAEPETDEAEQEVEKEFPLVPNEWSADEKAQFQALIDSDDPEKQLAAQILIERYNNLKRGFYEKSKKAAEQTKELQEINQVFQPFQQAMQTSGISKAQYMQNMVMWEQALHQKPVETVKQIMQKFGVKPEQLGIENNELNFDVDYDNDKVTQLETELKQLKQQIANQPVQAQIAQFENATDPSGKLRHPRFKEVAPLMGTLIQTGKAQTLEEAYTKAIRVVDANESSEPEQTQAVDVEKLRQKVAQSKKAAKSVKTGGSRPDFSKMSLRDELAARLVKS